ncbi:MAG: aminoacyl-tRNA hydrolase [Nitrospirota bacterium]|nr:aminoacyl-tRNA hydrolase [Nitrospirota bacterium]
MRIVIGLGNPGRKYERTRHNAGFMAADELARQAAAPLAQEKHHALMGKLRLGAENVLVAKPQTFMNDSGRSVAAVMRDAYAAVGDIIVVHDELDLPLGTVRIKTGGGHGGHNGLRSLIDSLGSADFIRVRVGIGRPPTGMESADYVLSPFGAEERAAAAEAIDRAAEAVRMIIADGLTKAMNAVNQK